MIALRSGLSGVLASIALLAGLLASAAAPAQPATPLARDGAWLLDCTAEPNTGAVWCEVGTRLESVAPPYDLQFNYVRDSRMFFAMGSSRLSRVVAQVDAQTPFVLERCLGGMCLIKGKAGELLLKEMREGAMLTLQCEGVPRPPGPLAIPLAGFDRLYRRAVGLAN